MENKNKQIGFLTNFLKGIGQIMLQENAWTGLLFLAGIFYGSYIMGIAAVVAALTGLLTAKLLKYNAGEINMGLYGFNATLVGVALVFLFQPVVVIWIAIIAGSVLATIFTHFCVSRKIPGFTFPFIAITWILIYLFRHWYVVPAAAAESESILFNNDFTLMTHGFGEVIFQGSIVAGILFFIAVFVSSPVGALYGLLGSCMSSAFAYYFTDDINAIHLGLFSFNAVLCAITFSGTKVKDGFWVLLSIVLALLIQFGMLKMEFAVLTFPFVASSWIVLLIKKLSGN